ncbi:MAG: inner membrane CreD family protein [Turneriella sp.]|nr:inner membrane CreD family protein [Turneriella sp.]
MPSSTNRLPGVSFSIMKKNKLRNQILWLSLLTLILTMLASLVLPLVSERAQRRETVLREMARIWGAPQMIAGPVGFAGDTAIEMSQLRVDGDLKVSLRRKGIYRFPLYAAKLQFTGELRRMGARQMMLKSRARLRIEKASLANAPLLFSETVENGIFVYKASVPAGFAGTRVQLQVAAEGLQSFSLLPVATETELRLTSDWNDPGFFGDFLPLTYDIQKSGFSATWKVSGVAARKWSEIFAAVDRHAELATPGVFGVSFYQAADIYLVTERSVKYAILFIALTLAALFLFELVSSAQIHPMQYFLAGLGIVIFYLLLLALSEYLGFAWAYLIAGSANTILLSRYSGGILLSRAHAVQFTLIIAGLYALLYVILQLEEAALLSGSLTLFAALALTMYLTRRVDWYAVGEAK